MHPFAPRSSTFTLCGRRGTRRGPMSTSISWRLARAGRAGPGGQALLRKGATQVPTGSPCATLRPKRLSRWSPSSRPAPQRVWAFPTPPRPPRTSPHSTPFHARSIPLLDVRRYRRGGSQCRRARGSAPLAQSVEPTTPLELRLVVCDDCPRGDCRAEPQLSGNLLGERCSHVGVW